MVRVAVAGADSPSARSAKEGVAGLLGMEGNNPYPCPCPCPYPYPCPCPCPYPCPYPYPEPQP